MKTLMAWGIFGARTNTQVDMLDIPASIQHFTLHGPVGTRRPSDASLHLHIFFGETDEMGPRDIDHIAPLTHDNTPKHLQYILGLGSMTCLQLFPPGKI